jgi:hypothetical protein
MDSNIGTKGAELFFSLPANDMMPESLSNVVLLDRHVDLERRIDVSGRRVLIRPQHLHQEYTLVFKPAVRLFRTYIAAPPGGKEHVFGVSSAQIFTADYLMYSALKSDLIEYTKSNGDRIYWASSKIAQIETLSQKPMYTSVGDFIGVEYYRIKQEESEKTKARQGRTQAAPEQGQAE